MAIRYFDTALTLTELDRLSTGFAAALVQRGVRPGARVAVQLQNMPQFVVAVIGTWKAGGTVVPVNPMLRERELGFVLGDAGCSVLVALEHEAPSVAVDLLVTTSGLDLQSRDDDRVFAGIRRDRPDGAEDMLTMIEAADIRVTPALVAGPDDVAFLTYTSGTTGPPKGAMNTHANVAFQAQTYRDWCSIGPDDVILATAPLFHITGLDRPSGAGPARARAAGARLPVPPRVYRDAVREHGCHVHRRRHHRVHRPDGRRRPGRTWRR